MKVRPVLVIAVVLPAIFGAGSAVSGQVFKEFPVPTATSAVSRIALGPDGALWFTENSTDKIGRITPGGFITEFLITPGAGPDQIAAGPDGALWFCEVNVNRIGRITTLGALAEFSLSPGTVPVGIAAGPDGAMWFAESGDDGGAIGRIATDGEITEFPLATANSASPQGIAAGPDGALWFTENLGVRIGRITTGGSITEFPVPTNASLGSIVAGPDGALWFAEVGADRIGRSTTAGVVTEFPIPTAFSLPGGISAGPDGALWFTEEFGNKIGRITTAGAITEFPVPTVNATPIGIAAGPDGAMWFTEFNGNAIGRLTAPGANPVLAIAKSAAASVVSGQNLTYTLTYGNSGSGGASGVVISDVVPAGTDFVSATNGGTAASGVVTWTVGDLNAGVTGQTVSFIVKVTVLSGAVTNSTYAISATGIAGVTGPAVSTAVTGGGTPTLAISKSAAASVATGQNLTYTLTFGNSGSAGVTSAIITDAVPVGTTFVSATGGGTFASGVVGWAIGDLNAGVTGQTVSFTVKVTATSGTITNSLYSIRATGISAVTGSPVSTTVVGTPALTIAKSAPASVVSGQNLTYTLTYGNSGSGGAAGVTIGDAVPAGTAFISATGGGTFASGVVTWTVGGLNAGVTGQTVSFTVAVLAASGSIINTAYSIQASGVPPVSGAAVLTAVLPATGVKGIVAVVASIPGVPPSLFKTGFQMNNPTASVLAGRLVFHPQGVAGSDADPSLGFSLAAGQTMAFDDLLPAMGLAGPRIGSLDIVMPLAAPAPVVFARIFNDAGAGGTTGFTLGAASPDEILGAGDQGVLLTPADISHFRMNIGVRTGRSGASMTVVRRNAAGTIVQTLAKSYPATFFEQITGAEFLAGTPFGASDSITIQVTAGSAIVYGITADNTTQDPSIQFAARLP